MKKFKRFKQSYRDVLNMTIDIYVLPTRTSKHRAKCAHMLGLGEMLEWANGAWPTGDLWKAQ